MVLLAVVIGRALPAGNGFNGQVGVMAGPDGQPVAVIGLCQGSADTLVVLDLESDLADQSWEERGEEAKAASLRHNGALDGVTTVDLSEPSARWSGSALGDPARGEGDLNITATGRGSLLNDTYFTRAQIEQLAPGMVTFSVWEHPFGPYTGNEQVPLADFADIACSGRGAQRLNADLQEPATGLRPSAPRGALTRRTGAAPHRVGHRQRGHARPRWPHEDQDAGQAASKRSSTPRTHVAAQPVIARGLPGPGASGVRR